MSGRVTFAGLLGGMLMLTFLALYGPGGQYAPYLAMGLEVIAIPYVLIVRNGRPLQPDPAALAFVVAFLLITAAYWFASSKPSDVLIVANFGWLLLFAPLQSLMKRLAAPNAAVTIARLALIGVAATLGWAIYERLQFDVTRVGRLSSDPIRIANTAVILGFLSLTGLRAERGRLRLLYLAGPLLAVGVAVLAETRGAIVSSCILALLCTALLVRRKGLALLIALGLAVVASVALLVAARLHVARVDTLIRSIQQLLSGEAVSNTSAKTRLAMLQAAWSAFLDSPWYGHGWQRMMKSIIRYLPEGQETLTRGQPHLHNDIADFGVSAGVMGLVAYVTIILTPLLVAWRSVRDSLYRARLFGVTVLVACYAVLGLNALMFGYEVHTALYCGLVAILLGFCRENNPFAVRSVPA
ncbi:MAG: O-antigen ligase family protein [Devosia nanyangense]|uniref:O-antigen ligase family protein n=1 Tax=Devosia nanyangense TaxID=1228055 RepID=A0A933L1A8_9HYPH|nr:O-antigen ligase family protein [Devosia nanyangense]